jgi:hypothetical protein
LQTATKAFQGKQTALDLPHFLAAKCTINRGESCRRGQKRTNTKVELAEEGAVWSKEVGKSLHGTANNGIHVVEKCRRKESSKMKPSRGHRRWAVRYGERRARSRAGIVSLERRASHKPFFKGVKEPGSP